MPTYTKPPFSQIPFTFTTGGYQTPNFSNVPFRFGIASQTADLQAAITVISQDQADLGAFITVVSEATHDLGAYIKSTIQASKNLGAYIKLTAQDTKDLGAAIRRIDAGTKDLGALLQGFQTKDLISEIGAHPPADIQAILNIIEIRNLPASLTGILFKGDADLGGLVYKIFQRDYLNMSAFIRAWSILDLPASMNIIHFLDLLTVIKIFTPSSADLGALIDIVEVGDLGASLHGWQEKFLGAVLIGAYGPNDIQAYLNPVPSQNLSAYIAGFKGIEIPFDLPASVSSWGVADLNAVIGLIEAAELGASIFAAGKLADLGATIIPNTILMKRALLVSLLEHRDLKAVINFQCFASTFSNLSAYMNIYEKLDLKGFIVGWYGDGTADTIRDLGAFINAEDYYVEDKFTINFVPEVEKYTQLKIGFTVRDVYTAFDTLPVLYGTFNAGNLAATITGILRSVDLGATVTPILQTNYTELPENINPKTHEVVIDFTEKWRENWRRFVELMFKRDGAEPYHYFYVSGSSTVYKIDRDRHWTIWADSYLQDTDSMIERRSVRTKFIFNMSNYATIDAAVRDLIDRVSAYREADLGAYIDGGMPPYADISAAISAKYKRTWVKHLKATITGV